MFDRIKYKNFAKIQLKNRFKIPVLMVLFTGLILIFLSIPQALSDSASINQEVSLNSFYTSVDIPFTQNLVNDISNILTFIVSCIFSMATAFVYIKMSKSPDKIFFSDFIEGFSLWKKGILSGLWQSLWIFLWSLLFFIYLVVDFIVCHSRNHKILRLFAKFLPSHRIPKTFRYAGS